MAFIGNQPALAYTSFAVQHFTTSATTSYTLNYPVANENEIRLVINNVVQQPGSSYAYTASGTSLTLSAATTGTDTMYAVFLGKAIQTVNPPNGSVGLSQLSATGTPSSTTFLRGDNTWGSAGATAGQIIQVVTATDSTSRSSTSSTYVTGSNTLSVSITPASTSNKIFVLYTGAVQNVNVANATSWFTIYRNGSTNLGAGSNSALGSAYVAANNLVVNMSIGYLDSPATTSSTTYQVYFKNDSATTVYLNAQGSLSSITAFEVKG